MTYDELCISLTESGAEKPRGTGKEIGTVHFATVPSYSGNDSSNSVLASYLQEKGIDYLHTFTGTIWFFFEQEWTRVVSAYDQKNSQFIYTRCLFD